MTSTTEQLYEALRVAYPHVNGQDVPEKWVNTVRDAAFDEEGYTIDSDLAEVYEEMLVALAAHDPERYASLIDKGCTCGDPRCNYDA